MVPGAFRDAFEQMKMVTCSFDISTMRIAEHSRTIGPNVESEHLRYTITITVLLSC